MSTVSQHWTIRIVSALCGILLVVAGYLTYITLEQRDKIASLIEDRQYFLRQSQTYKQAYETAENRANSLETELATVQRDLELLADDYRDERNRNAAFEDQIRQIAGTVGTLDRLNQIDRELLQKYSRISFLNENYIPRRLVQIADRFVHPSANDEYFLADAYPHLENLLRAAERARLDLQILSAYRSFDHQADLKSRYLVTYGEGANRFSADQGFSEHQLGTAVDFTTGALGGTLDGRFADTEEYAWLLENAHRFGFILSYPEDNEFYIFEPWHWRFVGRDLARDLHRENAHFYDWDQRRINEYLLTIFD